MDNFTKYFFYLSFLSFLVHIGLSEQSFAQVVDAPGDSTGRVGAPAVQRFDTRSVSLAGATMADPSSTSSVNINPALISFVKQPRGVHYHIYQNWNNNLFQQNFTLPAIRVANHTIVFQAAFTSSAANFDNPFAKLSMPVPDMTMYDLAMGYSFSLNDILSFGVFNNFSFARDENSRRVTYFADIGMLYTPSDYLFYGLVFRGLGSNIIYRLSETGTTTLDNHMLRQSLEIGTTLRFPVEDDHPWMTISFSNEKLFGKKGIWYKGGLELKPTAFLALRSGLIFEPNDRFVAPRYGFGINSDGLKLDYALSPKQVFNKRFHQISLTLQF